MQIAAFGDVELEPAWLDDDRTARWRSAPGHAGAASGSSLLEVDSGMRLPRHTDSAEETIAVVSGVARVTVADAVETLGPGAIAVVPKDVPHEVESIAETPLRFFALYAGSEVLTTYERDVQPAGERSREPF